MHNKVINLNLIDQFNLFLKSRLEEMGVTEGFKLEDACFQYLNLKQRLVDPLPRKVHFSKQFDCPSNLKEGLNLIKVKIEKGEDITPHLSGKFKDLNYQDMMLNDWGIHHLHLGTKLDEKTGLVKRTGPILYVKFDNDNAYFIQVMKHGEWANDEIIKIIHTNWPESIKDYRLRSISIPEEHNLTKKQRAKFRDAGITTVVKVTKDIIYAPLGGGYVSSGHSLNNVRQCDSAKNNLNIMEQNVRDNFSRYEAAILEHTGYNGNRFDFILEISDMDNKVHITEKNSGARIYLGKL